MFQIYSEVAKSNRDGMAGTRGLPMELLNMLDFMVVHGSEIPSGQREYIF